MLRCHQDLLYMLRHELCPGMLVGYGVETSLGGSRLAQASGVAGRYVKVRGAPIPRSGVHRNRCKRSVLQHQLADMAGQGGRAGLRHRCRHCLADQPSCQLLPLE